MVNKQEDAMAEYNMVKRVLELDASIDFLHNKPNSWTMFENTNDAEMEKLLPVWKQYVEAKAALDRVINELKGA
jgi:hypothetical protein